MTVVATYTIPGMRVRDHVTDVPLDWSDPTRGTIQIFAREIVDPVRAGEDLPCLVYLQGGPGGKGPRPVDRSGWLGVALRDYRIVLMDQRGTGRSTPPRLVHQRRDLRRDYVPPVYVVHVRA